MANPLLNETDRRGIKIRTTNADKTVVARLTPAKKGGVYMLDIRVVGVRVLTSATTQPAAFVYWRYAAYVTSATGAVTQVGAVSTLGADKETDAGADIWVETDGTNVDISVSASYPTDWSVYVIDVVNDQVLIG